MWQPVEQSATCSSEVEMPEDRGAAVRQILHDKNIGLSTRLRIFLRKGLNRVFDPGFQAILRNFQSRQSEFALSNQLEK